MSYINKDDLFDELGEQTLIQLTDNDESGEIDDAKIAKAISHAQGVCDAYLRTRYALPVPATPMVKTINIDIAIFHLYKRAEFDEGVYKVRKNANDDGIKLLTAINQGKAGLDVPANEETIETPATTDRILTNKSNAVFTDGKLSNY